MPNQPNQGGDQSNKEKKREERRAKWAKRGAEAEAAAAAVSPFISSISSLGSPFKSFVNYMKSLAGLLLVTAIGSTFAFGSGSLLIAALALLVEPMFAMSLLSTLTRPLITPFANAVGNTKNPILRPFYDYVALLTVGLPYALAWYWEGKLLGIGLLLLSSVNVNYLGYAIAYYALAFTAAGLMPLINRASRGLGGIGKIAQAFSFIMSVYIGTVIASLIFLWFFGTAPFPTIGAVGGFILSILTLREMNKLVPTHGKVPATWSIIALIIGASALMGFYGIFIAVMVALVIYFAILYVISGNATWLWYTVIAVPSAPAVAYYLGYVTKFLLDTGGLLVGEIIAGSLESSLAIIYLIAFAIVVIIIIAIFIMLIPEFLFLLFIDIFILIGVIIGIIFAVIFLLSSINIFVPLVNLPGSVNAAYNYLVYPA